MSVSVRWSTDCPLRRGIEDFFKQKGFGITVNGGDREVEVDDTTYRLFDKWSRNYG